jgi:hypothetical protein
LDLSNASATVALPANRYNAAHTTLRSTDFVAIVAIIGQAILDVASFDSLRKSRTAKGSA